MVEQLNSGVLPPGFRARPTESIVGIEPDVLLLQMADVEPTSLQPSPALSTATTQTILPIADDTPVIGIYSSYDGNRLVSIIELLSPRNKDRPKAIRSFVEKIVFLLQDGVHVTVIDVLSVPTMPVRAALLPRLGIESENDVSGLWISSFAALPVLEPVPQVDVKEWGYQAVVGEPLPDVPLFLYGDDRWVWLDLEQSYQATLRGGAYELR